MNKLKFLTHTLFIVAAASSINAKSFAEPANLSLLKEEIVAYHDSGAYSRDIESVANQAKQYIEQRVAENQRGSQLKKLAIVLDIDDTSLSYYDKMQANYFSNDKKLIFADLQRADLPAINPIHSLYELALKENIAVFFVTGRPPELRDATVRNLKQAHYDSWTGIYFRPAEDRNKSVIPYKSNARKIITEQGYTIVASIGDQVSDYEGGYAEKGFKLPNPYYYLG